MSITIPTSLTTAFVAVASIAMQLGTQPASSGPAPEPVEPVTSIQTCPRIDDHAHALRARGFSAQAAKNNAVIIRQDCLDENQRPAVPPTVITDAHGHTLHR